MFTNNIYNIKTIKIKKKTFKKNLTIPKLCPNSLSEALGLQINKKKSKISQP